MAVDEARAGRALAHPLRAEVLRRLDGEAMSPSELAGELGRSVNTIAYHVNQLAADGLVRVARTRTRRGAVERFYTAAYRLEVTVERIRG